MPPDLAPAHSTIRALDMLDDAAHLIGAVHERLVVLGARARALAAATDWRAPSAQAFHERIDSWQQRMAEAESRAAHALDSLALVRAQVQTRMWTAPS